MAVFREFEVGGCLGESTPRVGTLSRRLLTPSMGPRVSKVTGVIGGLGRGNEKTRPSLAGSCRPCAQSLAVSTRSGRSFVHISLLVISKALAGISLIEWGPPQAWRPPGPRPQQVLFPVLSEGHRCGKLLPFQLDYRPAPGPFHPAAVGEFGGVGALHWRRLRN